MLVLANIQADSVEELKKLANEFYPEDWIKNKGVVRIDYKSEYKYSQSLVIETPGKPLS